ncbi:MAG: FKBP-type peptidyl-prolyl cis-trans isomerase [Gammaproteobacteria bacterium]|nr:FKBP-type peptidyl-prolyl cis-trans isomerase [Gammaproteobacteria bacterium]
MMKIYYAIVLFAVFLLSACGQQDTESETETAVETADELVLETTEERLSYGIAYGLAERLKADGVPLVVSAFNAGLRDAFEGAQPKLSKEEIGREMQAYQQKQSSKQETQVQQVAEKNIAEGTAFLAENATKDGVVVLESGLQYKVLKAGDGPMPGEADTVEVHYSGTLIDGTEFDSSYSRGSTVSFGVTQVIAGWTEALQLMSAGSKWQLFIPAELAYGAGGAGPMIGPNATLIFDVELLQIAPTQ